MSRYESSYYYTNPVTGSVPINICTDCGAVVVDEETHDAFHQSLVVVPLQTHPDIRVVDDSLAVCEPVEEQIFKQFTNPKRPLSVGELRCALDELDDDTIPIVLENSITGNDDEYLHAVSLDNAYEHTFYKKYPDGTVAAFTHERRLVLFFDQMDQP